MTNAQDTLERWLNDLKDDNPTVRSFATYSLRKYDDPAATQALIDLLGDGNFTVIRNAAKALAYKKAAEAVPALEKALAAPDPYVRSAAREAIQKIKAAHNA
jgi:HEAT repeat protein